VISILGEFLEHDRICYFRAGGQDRFFVGSADWMQRNLNDRVEAIAPIEDPALKEELRYFLDVRLADNCQAWELRPDGSYLRRQPAPDEERRSSQEALKHHIRQSRRAAEG
jgi:polyphosphate kinase